MAVAKTTSKKEAINQLHETEARWFAVKTRSKCEKAVAALLGKKQIVAYVPLVLTIRRYTRKVKKVEKPLIGCYVFVHIKKDAYVPVLETENVLDFVRFSRNPVAIPDEEIRILRRIVLESDIELEALSGTVLPGDPIIVSAGPLTGLAGKVVKADGKRKFQVELESLGYALLITIDAQFIQKTGNAFVEKASS
jgi:transcription antitermination factor NusG